MRVMNLTSWNIRRWYALEFNDADMAFTIRVSHGVWDELCAFFESQGADIERVASTKDVHFDYPASMARRELGYYGEEPETWGYGGSAVTTFDDEAAEIRIAWPREPSKSGELRTRCLGSSLAFTAAKQKTKKAETKFSRF